MFNNKNINKIMWNGKQIVGGYHNGKRLSLQQILTFLAKDISVTRAGLSANPVQRYSFTSGDVFNNDSLVKHGDSFFVGGDTATYDFDFGLKVAGSTVECPMKWYWSKASTLQAPSNITGNEATGFWEIPYQTDIDIIKYQDSNSMTYAASLNGQIGQFMVELDLTPLCNSFYGGSNSALKSAIKSIEFDVYAGASGNGGSGVNIDVWYGTWGYHDVMYNTTSTATRIYYKETAYPDSFITTNNKLYILISSKYPSNGTIPSSVSLDYLKISVSLARTPDVVKPILVNLPRYWAMVVKGFSPCWDSNNSRSRYYTIFHLYNDSDNRLSVSIIPENYLMIDKYYNATWSPSTVALSFGKNQVINIILMQTGSGMALYYLKNNDVVQKVESSDMRYINLRNLIIGESYINNNQSDAFAESFTLIDLEKIGKSNGFADAEADAILRCADGNVLGLRERELFDASKITIHQNALISGNNITLNATNGWQSTYIKIPVLPNNQYEISANVSSGGLVYADRYYGNIQVSGSSNFIFTNNKATFITDSKTTHVVLIFTSSDIGTFTFKDISLKLKM